jgi:subtilase family serine protease
MQFAAQGQTIFQSSGDGRAFLSSGVNAKGGDPSYSPYLTMVGGTILITASDQSYKSETVWTNDDGITGSGGGYIAPNYAIPLWQQSIDMSVNHGSTAWRNFPDVCIVADHCYIISNNGKTGSFWGTSLAAPLWAGFTALVNQQASAQGKPAVGFLNPAIYAIAQGPLYASCFHDVTVGNNTWSYSRTQFYATTGYDLCTGWGSPNGINLINALAGYGGPIYVDFNYTGATTNGSYSTPFKTLASGTNAVAAHGTIIVRTAGSSSETMTISKPMTITAIGGAATVGR